MSFIGSVCMLYLDMVLAIYTTLLILNFQTRLISSVLVMNMTYGSYCVDLENFIVLVVQLFNKSTTWSCSIGFFSPDDNQV